MFELAAIAEAARPPDQAGVVRWRCIGPADEVEHIRPHMRQEWLSNRVSDGYDAIIDAVCDA